MNRLIGVSTWLLVISAAALLVIAGCGGAKPKPGEVFPCVADGKLDKTIAPEASLEDFSCVYKTWKGSETLHFNVAVKNISSTDQRFKVNIFLENDKAVGGLIPRKTKKGLVKPGQIAKFTYPVKG
ncbi:MAG: hypothetical protein JSV38_06785, partial [Desulfobacterales bacterium]